MLYSRKEGKGSNEKRWSGRDVFKHSTEEMKERVWVYGVRAWSQAKGGRKGLRQRKEVKSGRW